MEKINIAELLKDCPQGMELYSPIFGNVYLDKIRPHLAIVVTTDKKQGDFKEEFLYDGRYGMNGECMLFPSKDKTTWEEFEKSFKDNENLEENKFPSFEPMFKMNDELEYKIPDGYEITEVSKDKVFIKPIKPKYPKTFDECLNILYCKSVLRTIIGHKAELLFNLEKLLICRNAYWKIAGDEMGLGKPWEPRNAKDKYIIRRAGDTIVKGYDISCVLEFPTKEMRDAFYDNLRILIENCKELL